MEIGGLTIPVELVMRSALIAAMAGWFIRRQHNVRWTLWRFVDDYGSWVTILTLAFAAPYALFAVLTAGHIDLKLSGPEAGIFWVACLCVMRLLAERVWNNWTTLPKQAFAE